MGVAEAGTFVAVAATVPVPAGGTATGLVGVLGTAVAAGGAVVAVAGAAGVGVAAARWRVGVGVTVGAAPQDVTSRAMPAISW